MRKHIESPIGESFRVELKELEERMLNKITEYVGLYGHPELQTEKTVLVLSEPIQGFYSLYTDGTGLDQDGHKSRLKWLGVHHMPNFIDEMERQFQGLGEKSESTEFERWEEVRGEVHDISGVANEMDWLYKNINGVYYPYLRKSN